MTANTKSPQKLKTLDRIPGVRPCVDFVFRHRIAIAMIVVTLLFSWMGFHFWDRYGLLVGFFSAMALISLVFFYVERRASRLFPSIELEGVDPDGILRTVGEIARRVGVLSPQVFILELETPTAFSAGLFERNSKLFLSRGLLDRFSKVEIQLLLSYELERLKNEQTQSLTALTAVASLIATVANAFDAALFFPFFRRRRELRIFGPMTLLTSPLVALLIRLSSPQLSILQVDRQVGRTTTSAEGWAQTLWKLDAYNKTLPLDVNLAEASLFVVNPLNRFLHYPWCRFASAQPAVETRIHNLTGRFPL